MPQSRDRGRHVACTATWLPPPAAFAASQFCGFAALRFRTVPVARALSALKHKPARRLVEHCCNGSLFLCHASETQAFPCRRRRRPLCHRARRRCLRSAALHPLGMAPTSQPAHCPSRPASVVRVPVARLLAHQADARAVQPSRARQCEVQDTQRATVLYVLAPQL
ncbi:hypothetical protein BC831DRAFT_469889 [Entophlyctis helioformis]|nr:hypothetical protein BC831DRAFT_469889 [Entophlyctis helioformis]